MSAEQRDLGSGDVPAEYWRNIVLYGRNVATYKFALAKSLLEFGRQERELVSLAELAVPFAGHICEHAARVDRQGTFQHSRFLDACRYFNAGRIGAEELRDITVERGFVNVIDAFHIVGSLDVGAEYYLDERRTTGGIRLTDALLALAADEVAADLDSETEARWRLVEETWAAKAEGYQLTVLYDAPNEVLVPALKGKRRNLAEVRPAFNGYQRGRCFYCRRPISVSRDATGFPDIDHFLPHVLMTRGLPIDLDLPWNLVLACISCNRGERGKADAVPHERYLERLFRRNEALIASNHPLRETVIAATGRDSSARSRFLRNAFEVASERQPNRAGWRPARSV